MILYVFVVYLHKEFNNKARITLNREFSVTTEKGKWIDGFHELQVHLITEYLIEHNLYSKLKIERLGKTSAKNSLKFLFIRNSGSVTI